MNSAAPSQKAEHTCLRRVIQSEHMLAYMFYTVKNESSWIAAHSRRVRGLLAGWEH